MKIWVKPIVTLIRQTRVFFSELKPVKPFSKKTFRACSTQELYILSIMAISRSQKQLHFYQESRKTETCTNMKPKIFSWKWILRTLVYCNINISQIILIIVKGVNKVKLNSFSSHHLDFHLNHRFDALNVFLTFHVSFFMFVVFLLMIFSVSFESCP